MRQPLCFLFVLCFTLQGIAQTKKLDSIQKILNTSEDAKTIASAYIELTQTLQKSDSVAYRKYLKESLLYARTINDSITEFTLARNHMQYLYAKGEYETMRSYADSLLPFVRKHNLVMLECRIHNHKGMTYSNQSDYPKAVVEFLNYYETGKKFLPDDYKQVALATVNLGMALMNMERYDQAIEYLNKSLAYQKKVENFKFTSNTYWNLGLCHMYKGEHEKALEIFNLGVEEAERTNNDYALVGNQLSIAATNLRQKNYEEGILMYEEVYKNSLKVNVEPYKLIEALDGMIFSHNHLGRPEKSMPYVKIVDSIIEANDMPDSRNLDYLLHKGTIMYQLGRPKEGDAILQRFLDAKDSLFSKQNIELIQEKETEFRTKEKEQQIELQQTELELQESELESQRLFTLGLGAGALLLALIGFLVYRQQRLKIKQQKQEQELREALLAVENKNKLEEQRLRISKELHDNIGSQLTYLAGSAQNIGYGIGKVPNDVTEHKLQELSKFSQDAIADLRDTIWVMNRNLVTWEDLTERLRYLAHKVANTTGVHVEVINEGDTTTTLDPSETMHIFRIVQEAVNNAVKHSKATQIIIKVTSVDFPIIIIEDNGVGYSESEVTSSSNGLKNMKARADELSAELEIDTSSAGTLIKLKLPARR